MQRALTSGPITGSILLGLCIGSGVVISMQYGSGESVSYTHLRAHET